MRTNSTARLQTHFRIVEFCNRGGSKSWRVSGIGRDGKRVRQNFSGLEAARAKHLELEADYLGRQGPEILRATTLSDEQLRIAEAAFLRLDINQNLLVAVEHWLTTGKLTQSNNEKRLDAAVDEFCAWLESAPFREKTRINLKSRAKIFRSLVGDVQLGSITPELIDGFLAKRNVSAVTQDNDRRAISRFFRYCSERPRRWMSHNPCREVSVSKPEKPEPGILSINECKALLKAARKYKRGKLLGYIVLGLFGGLRPFEAARLTWGQINLADREIRIDGAISKTKRSRVIPINVSLKAWLSLCRGKAFAPGDWDNELRTIRATAKIKHWPADVLRHTALSHYFRKTESFGATAEWAGTSETVIRVHYMARVSSKECRRFWKLRP